MSISTNAVITDTGRPDAVIPDAPQIPVEDLPEEALVFLLASRFCDSDQLLDLAWKLFGAARPGWGRVQAICDFVHKHIEFGYAHARATQTASEAYSEKRGVCRDYAHMAVASAGHSTFRQGTAPVISVTSGRPRRIPPVILPPGLRPTSADTGTPLTHATTFRVSGES